MEKREQKSAQGLAGKTGRIDAVTNIPGQAVSVKMRGAWQRLQGKATGESRSRSRVWKIQNSSTWLHNCPPWARAGWCLMWASWQRWASRNGWLQWQMIWRVGTLHYDVGKRADTMCCYAASVGLSVKLYMYPVWHVRQSECFLNPHLSLAFLHYKCRKAEKRKPCELFPAPRGEGEPAGHVWDYRTLSGRSKLDFYTWLPCHRFVTSRRPRSASARPHPSLPQSCRLRPGRETWPRA